MAKRSDEVDKPERDDSRATSQEKKTYRKPVLSKYEQLHGIGIGS
jgi:hypothetical protein